MTANLRIAAIERPLPLTQPQISPGADTATAADAVAAKAKHDPGAALALLHGIVARSILEDAGGGALLAASAGLAGWSRRQPDGSDAQAGRTLGGSVSNGRLAIEGRQAFHEIDPGGKSFALVVIDRDATRGGYLVFLDAASGDYVRSDEPIFERAGFRESRVEIKVPLEVETFLAIAPETFSRLLRRAALLEELLHGALDLGLLQGFSEAAHEHIRTRTRPWQGQSLAKATDDPHLVRRYGEYVATLRALEGLIEEAKAAVAPAHASAGASSGQNAIEAVAAARAYAILAGRSVISGTIELLGAGATSQRYGFDIFWRDFTAHAVAHPPLWPFETIGRDFVRSTGGDLLP